LVYRIASWLTWLLSNLVKIPVIEMVVPTLHEGIPKIYIFQQKKNLIVILDKPRLSLALSLSLSLVFYMKRDWFNVKLISCKKIPTKMFLFFYKNVFIGIQMQLSSVSGDSTLQLDDYFTFTFDQFWARQYFLGTGGS